MKKERKNYSKEFKQKAVELSNVRGNLSAIDSNRKELINSVIKYYTTSFSSKEGDQDYLWTYQDIWK